MQIKKTEIDNLKKKFEEKRHDIQLLFISDLSKSKRMLQSEEQYLKNLFKKLQNIVGMEILHKFHQYLLIELNIPIQIKLKFLNYKQFIQLFDAWIESLEKLSYSIIDYEIENIIQLQFRNEKFQEILRLKSQQINQYAEILSPNKRFSDFDFNLLLRSLFTTSYLYEFNNDTQTFFDKINSFDSLMNILARYRLSQRKQSFMDDPKFIYIKQIPHFFKFWQQINPELTVQQEIRKNVLNAQTQTQQSQKGQEYQSLEKILNETIRKLSKKKKQNNLNEVMQSIDKMLLLIKKQRYLLFPKYKTIDMSRKGSFQQTNIKQGQESVNLKKIENMLQQIYSFYSNKSRSTNGFDDKILRYPNQQIFDTKKLYNFLEDIGILKSFYYPRSSKLVLMIKNNVTNPNQILFHQFFAFINQFMATQTELTINLIEKFTENNIRELRGTRPRKFVSQLSDNLAERINYYENKQQNHLRNENQGFKKSIPSLSVEKSPNNSNNGKRYLKKYQNEKSIKKISNISDISDNAPKTIQTSVPIIMLKHNYKFGKEENDKNKLKGGIYSNLGYKKQ